MQQIIKYSFWGVLATIINIVCYLGLNAVTNYPNELIVNNIIAWLVSVIFAYYTNSYYVFDYPDISFKKFCEFSFARIITLIIETMLLSFFVHSMLMKVNISKFIASVAVIILNYLFSKVLVFKPGKE